MISEASQALGRTGVTPSPPCRHIVCRLRNTGFHSVPVRNQCVRTLLAPPIHAAYLTLSTLTKELHMRTLKLALLATVAVAGVSTAASAADLIVNTAPPPVVVDNYSAVDWNGPYAGLFISGQTDSIYGLGADLGVNTLINNNLLAGVEGSVQWLNNDSWQGQVNGKLGFAAENFAFYGLAGIGANSETEGYVPVGVGAEVKLTDDFSLKAEYQYQWDIDGDDDDVHAARIGFNWHF